MRANKKLYIIYHQPELSRAERRYPSRVKDTPLCYANYKASFNQLEAKLCFATQNKNYILYIIEAKLKPAGHFSALKG